LNSKINQQYHNYYWLFTFLYHF